MSIRGHFAAALDHLGFPYDEQDDGRTFRLSVADGASGLSWTCVAYPLDDTQQAVFFSVAPEDVPTEARGRVAEYLTRVNYGLVLGNFEMDWTDGEVRCRTSVHVGDTPHAQALIEPIVTVNVGLMGRYLPGLHEVVVGDTTPQAAVTSAEAGS